MNDPLIFVRRFHETHIDLKNETGIDFGIGVSGKYLVEVCRDRKVIRQPFGSQMRPNLITTGFFDYVMTNFSNDVWRRAIQYANAGTGTTAPANSDTKLTTWSIATNSLFTGGGNAQSNDTTNGAATWTFVYEFATAGSGVTYNEAGLSSVSGGASGLTTHLLFPSGVVLNAGDNLRLTYSLTFSIPCLITPITVSMAAVNGFNVSGSMKVTGPYANFFGTVNTGDTTTLTGGVGSVAQAVLTFGAGSGTPQLGSAPTTFATVNTNQSFTIISGATGTNSLASYTTGSLTRNQTFTWTTSQPSTTASNVNIINFTAGNINNGGLMLILTSTQTKANTNTLAITLSCTMARV